MTPAGLQLVQQLLTDKTGEKIGRLKASPVSGGDINRAFRLDDGMHQFFIKTNSSERLQMFEAEQYGLEEIRRSGSIRAPRPIVCGIAADQAFIVMEYLDLSGQPDALRLSQEIASLHLLTQDKFGFAIDNTIGSTPQPNSGSDDWVNFWQKHRLGYQLSLARRNGLGSELFDSGMRLNERLGQFFSGYTPLASLLHGDLWGGNMGTDDKGNPVIYDPACYYGDHEADLAMMELFSSPGKRFFEAYNEVFPIDDGYSQRRELYNLYHILNHANLFGGSYAARARQMIASLLAQI